MKNEFNNISEMTINSLEYFWGVFLKSLPKVIGGILLLIIGWFIARLVSRLLKKMLSAKKVRRFTKSFDESKILANSDLNVDLATVLSKFIYWVIIILFLVIVSDNMGWSEVSKEVAALFRYLPKLLIATIIFVIGLYVANVLRQLLKASLKTIDFAGSTILSSIVYYVVVILITITALNQAGVQTKVISSNLLIIISSILLAFAIGFGLASKDLLRKILFSYYSNQSFKVGQRIKCDQIEGEIVALNNMSAHVLTSDGIEVIPIDVLMNTITKVKSA